MRKLNKPEVVWNVAEKPQEVGKNFGVYCYGKTIGETERLDEAIQLAEDNSDMAELRIIDYTIGIGYYF